MRDYPSLAAPTLLAGPVPAPCVVRSVHSGTPDTWPTQTGLTLGAYPTAVGCMRGHARSVAFELGLGSLLADTAELLTSELVTNAVHVSSRLRTIDPPIIRLWLAFNGAVLVIHVWDGSYEEPVIQQADTDAEMGRGLMIIKSLSDGWGSYPLPPGKVVWARIACGP